jgi:osmotically-inducible protein OsmY
MAEDEGRWRSEQDRDRGRSWEEERGRGGHGREGAGREEWGRFGREGREYGRGDDYGQGGYGRGAYGGYEGSFGGGYGREGYGRRDYGGSERGFGGHSREGGYGQEGYGGRYGREEDYGGYARGGQGGREERGFWQRASDEVASWFGSDEAERRREQDHRGRGPKGYRRSDERIRDDVSDRLADDPYVDASDIEVSVQNGEVTLSGMVDSRQARRRAEDLVENVSGVSHVQNNLRVRQQGGGYGTAGGAASGTGTGATTAGAGEAPRAGGMGESIAYAAETGSNAAGRGDETGGSHQTGTNRSGR